MSSYDRKQAARISCKFELQGTQALIHKERDSLIITQIKTHRLLDMLAHWEPLDESFPEMEDAPPQERDLFCWQCLPEWPGEVHRIAALEEAVVGQTTKPRSARGEIIHKKGWLPRGLEVGTEICMFSA